jgi:actin-related protein
LKDINNNFCSNFNIILYKNEPRSIKNKIEIFVSNILFNILQLQKIKREKCYIGLIMIDFYNPKLSSLYHLIIKTILDNNLINSIRLFPKTISPVFVSGYSSGIVVDVGYSFTQIIPICNGFAIVNAAKTINIGSSELQRRLVNYILKDNTEGRTKITDMNNFIKKALPHLDDILVRSTVCVENRSVLTKEHLIKLMTDYSKIDCFSDVSDLQVILINLAKLIS